MTLPWCAFVLAVVVLLFVIGSPWLAAWLLAVNVVIYCWPEKRGQ